MSEIDEPTRLLQQYLDGSATAEQLARLDELLGAGKPATDAFVEAILLDTQLSRYFSQEKLDAKLTKIISEFRADEAAGARTKGASRGSLHALTQAISTSPAAKKKRPANARLLYRRPRKTAWWIAAVVSVLMLVGLVGLGRHFIWPDDVRLLSGQIASIKVGTDGSRIEVIGHKPAVIGLRDGSQVELGPASVAVVRKPKPDSHSVELVQGRGRFDITPQHSGFEVLTAVGKINVVGTKFTVGLLSSDPNEIENQGDAEVSNKKIAWGMVVAVIAGVVDIHVGGKDYTLRLGESRVFAANADSGAPIPPDARVKPSDVHGLKVAFYDFPAWVPKGIDSLEDAKAYVNGSKPTVEYALDLTSISAPYGSAGAVDANSISLGDYLLGSEEFARRKAAAKTPLPARMSEPVNFRSVFIYSGFINAKKAGTFDIKIPVDDGDEVTVGGVVVHSKTEFGGMVSADAPAYAGRMTFVEPGIYPIRVLHWDREHELGVHLFSNIDPRGEILDGRVLMPILPEPQR
jgi:hypothetical protein